jgi:hypothetical protein
MALLELLAGAAPARVIAPHGGDIQHRSGVAFGLIVGHKQHLKGQVGLDRLVTTPHVY